VTTARSSLRCPRFPAPTAKVVRARRRANVLDALVVMLSPDDDLPAGDRERLVLTIVQ
jgi:hypothetical protein